VVQQLLPPAGYSAIDGIIPLGVFYHIELTRDTSPAGCDDVVCAQDSRRREPPQLAPDDIFVAPTTVTVGTQNLRKKMSICWFEITELIAAIQSIFGAKQGRSFGSQEHRDRASDTEYSLWVSGRHLRRNNVQGERLIIGE
jgi:hypothetical protein